MYQIIWTRRRPGSGIVYNVGILPRFIILVIVFRELPEKIGSSVKYLFFG